MDNMAGLVDNMAALAQARLGMPGRGIVSQFYICSANRLGLQQLVAGLP